MGHAFKHHTLIKVNHPSTYFMIDNPLFQEDFTLIFISLSVGLFSKLLFAINYAIKGSSGK